MLNTNLKSISQTQNSLIRINRTQEQQKEKYNLVSHTGWAKKNTPGAIFDLKATFLKLKAIKVADN